MRSQLYGMSPLDPIAVVGSGAVILLSALLASYLPARRTAAIEPMRVLREE
jgi:ABC-type lipoprotein release transport system permease subunit